MNADLRISTAFFENLKTVKLIRQLGSDGVVALLKVWTYAARHRPSGDFPCCSPEDLEIIAGWTGDPSALATALTDLRFIERTEQGFKIHDWEEHNNWAAGAEARTAKARKAAQARWERSDDATSIKEHCPENANSNAPLLSLPFPSLKTFPSDSEEIRLASLLLERIASRLPGFKQPDLQKWAVVVDRMIRLDKRPPGEIRRVIEWCQADPFWQTNILSAGKLREKFDQLRAKMPNAGTGKGNGDGWGKAFG